MSASFLAATFGEQTLAVMFTDVVDSTQILDRTEDPGDLWARHDLNARALLRSWNGREVGRSDGFLILFKNCKSAIGFAMAYHAMLAELPIPLTARVGFHWGTVVLRANLATDVSAGATPFEVDGVALPTAARVMSVANGGQTLFSRPAADLLRYELDATQRVHSHGHWRLKGLDEPLELFEIGAAEGALSPPAGSSKAYRVLLRDGLWTSAQLLPNNLGAEPDVFVGREKELRTLAWAFESGARTVTLLGIGGIGKTRLAQRYARGWLGDYPGGSWFCDLAQARGIDGIAFAVAQALNVPLGRIDPVDQLSALLAARGKCLVVLDNFEQVARFAGETLGRWMRAAPMAHFLVTSREVLGLTGEYIEGVPPLSSEEAILLFEHRLRSAGITDPLSAVDLDALPRMVELLDQLPLAVELAAARGRTVAPAELVRRMGERFRLLAARSGRHDRQATLRATIDWSWDLLSELERAALAQLSVFEGGFTLRATEAVLDLSLFDEEPWIENALQSLVEKSLVRRLSATRFDLLRTVKDYAAERLTQDLTTAFQRHWLHFAGFSEAEATLNGCIELGNVVIACRRAIEASAAGADPSAAACAVDALGNAWSALRLLGPFRVIVALAEQLANLRDLDALQRARVQRVLGGAAGLMGNADAACQHYEQALEFARAAGNGELEAQIQCLLGDLHALHGRPQAARAALEEAAKFVQGPTLATLMLHNASGNLELFNSDVAASIRHYKLALLIAEGLGDRRWQGGLHGSLGSAAVVQGDFGLGRQHLERAVEIATELGDRQWAGNAHCNLGLLLFESKQLDAAHHELVMALTTARALGHRRLEATTLCNLGLVSRALGQESEALTHLEASVALANDLKAPKSEGVFRGYLGELLGELGRADEADACHREAERLLRGVGDAAGLALLYCQQTMSASHRRDSTTAARTLQQAVALSLSLTAAPDAELSRALNRAKAAVNQHC